MSYREEMSRIRQNKINNRDCYTSLKDDSTLDKLKNMRTNLGILIVNHKELLRWNWDKLEDPGSYLEMWLYVIADVNEVIKRLEKEVLPHDCNGTCSECLVEVE